MFTTKVQHFCSTSKCDQVSFNYSEIKKVCELFHIKRTPKSLELFMCSYEKQKWWLCFFSFELCIKSLVAMKVQFIIWFLWRCVCDCTRHIPPISLSPSSVIHWSNLDIVLITWMLRLFYSLLFSWQWASLTFGATFISKFN